MPGIRKTISASILRYLAIPVAVLVVPLGSYWIAGSYVSSMRRIANQEDRLIETEGKTDESEIRAWVSAQRAETAERARRRVGEIALFLVAVILAGVLAARRMSRRMEVAFAAFSEFFRRVATESVEMDPGTLGFAEFEDLAHLANRMAAQRKRAEEDLRVSEERLKLAIGALKHGVWDFDLESGKIDYSHRWFAMLGYEPADLDPTYEMWAGLVHPDDREEFERGMREHRERGEPFSLEYRMRTRDGQWRWVLSRGQCVERDPQGKPRRLVGTNADIMPRKTAEIALRETTEYYRTLISNISDVIAILDERFEVKYASPNVERHFGFTPEELVGKKYWATVYPDDMVSVRERLAGLFREPPLSTRTLQCRSLRKNGAYAPIELTAVNMMENPLVRGILVNYRDISQRKRAEELLRKGEERIKLALEVANHGIWDFDLESGSVYFSPRWFIMLHYDVGELECAYDTWIRLLHPDEREEVERKIVALMKNGEPLSHEYRMRTREGEWKWFISRGRCVGRDSQGKPTRILGTNADINTRQHALEALRESEERVRLLLDSVAEAIFGLDLQGQCTMANPACVRLLGYASHDDLIGREMHDLIHHSRPDGSPYPAAECPILSTLALGEDRHIEEEALWRADGTCFPAEYWSHPIRHDGRVVGRVVTFLDITERKKAEEDKEDLEAQLRHSQKMEAIGQLAGGVAHDFNNLLQVIAGYADMAVQSLTPGAPPEPELQEVLRASQRAITLVRQLLTFSRREMLHPEYLNLNDLVGGVTKMLRRVIGEHIELTTSPGYELRPVFADPGQIEQVLMNLCVNARDAMPEGGHIAIATANIGFDETSVAKHPWAQQTRDFVMLSIRDTGVGIAPELQERIFEPFFTTKEVGRGTGLGLATVYGIVKQHEGHIEVESTPGRGATFRVYLPVASEPAVKIGPSIRRPTPEGGTETILLAEDDTMVRNLARAILERAGYRVLIARDGSQAVAAFEANPDRVNLALLDVVMPRLSGRAVADRIHAKKPGLPVIFCSGYDFNVLAATLPENEKMSLIRKPYSADDLLARVRETLTAAEHSDST